MTHAYATRIGHADDDGPGSLARLLERPAWHADALCREPPYSGLPWVPVNDRADASAQKAVCGRCLVTEQCLAAALELGNAEVGIRGGTTAAERRRMGRLVSESRRRVA